MCSYKDDMEPDELFEVISQCLLSSVDRDAYSGWGAEVYIITPEQIIQRRLKARMDQFACLFHSYSFCDACVVNFVYLILQAIAYKCKQCVRIKPPLQV